MTLLFALLIVLVARLVAFVFLPHAAEDGLIAFRVARNWSDGLGPYYNATEMAGSVTSVLWTAMLAFGAECGFAIERWSRVLALAFDLATVVAAHRLNGRRVVWFALVFALPIFGAACASGLETPLLTCALAWSAVTPWATGVLAWVRPEGIVAGLALARGSAWLVFGFGALAQVVLNAAYFGSAFPTAAAKAAVYGTHWFAGWHWLAPIVPLGMGQPVGVMEHLGALHLAALPMVWLARGHWRLTVAALGVLGAYWLTGTTGFWWYGVPWYAALAIGACGAQVAFPRPFAVVAVAVLLTLQLPGWKSVAELWLSEVPLYQLAERLKGERGTVFLEPAGHIGWKARHLRVVDEVGLVTPWVAERRRGEPGWWSDVIARERPEWVVVRASFLLDANPTAFAGVGAPVRSRAELDSVVAGYGFVARYGVQNVPGRSLVLLRRFDEYNTTAPGKSMVLQPNPVTL